MRLRAFLVCAAIGEGRRTALAIHAFLTGTDAAPLEAWFNDEGAACPAPLGRRNRTACGGLRGNRQHQLSRESPAQPDGGGSPRENVARLRGAGQGLTLEAARAEAARLHCGHCQSCWQCVANCPGLILKEGEHGPEVAYPDEVLALRLLPPSLSRRVHLVPLPPAYVPQ